MIVGLHFPPSSVANINANDNQYTEQKGHQKIADVDPNSKAWSIVEKSAKLLLSWRCVV